MKSISNIDSNFQLIASIEKDGMRFFHIDQEPFSIHGILKENGKYRRLPEKVAKTVSENVYYLHSHTAGGRVRFKTNSRKISILAEMDQISRMSHFAFTGSSGFDLYAKENHHDVYWGTFIPPLNMTDGYESSICLSGNHLRDITINFPLYSAVTNLYIGVENDAVLEKAEAYSHSKPIVYYGSSITQGGCASRPGNSYQSILSRKFHCDYMNLGFSGSAKAEDEIIEYIKQLEMSMFVFDYDHNAPTVEHLEATHEKMFQEIRKYNPQLPIIILSRPKYYLNHEEKKRLEIIQNTYQNALSQGDNHVYFLNGQSLMKLAKDDGTVDNCHPNDLGFFSMAVALEKVLKTIL